MSGESGSGAATVRVVTGLIVEKRRMRLAIAGRVDAPTCATDPDDCCAEPDALSCCPAGLKATLAVVIVANIGAGGALVVISGSVALSGARYTGTIEGESGTSVSFALDCRFGVWVASGFFVYANGKRKRFTVELETAGSELTGALEIPGQADGAIAVDSPCADAESGESGSGGSGGGGSVSFCGLTGLPSTLYAHFSGALAAYGTQALTNVGASYLKSPMPTGICGNNLNFAASLTCVNSATNEMQFSMPASMGTGFQATATPTTTSPLSITFTATTNNGVGGPGACAGSATVLVDENP